MFFIHTLLSHTKMDIWKKQTEIVQNNMNEPRETDTPKKECLESTNGGRRRRHRQVLKQNKLMMTTRKKENFLKTYRRQNILTLFVICLIISLFLLTYSSVLSLDKLASLQMGADASVVSSLTPQDTNQDTGQMNSLDGSLQVATKYLFPKAKVNTKDWVSKISEAIVMINTRANCLPSIKNFFEKKMNSFERIDVEKLRDSILVQINALLGQHKLAVDAIVGEAEKFAAGHHFVKNLKVNYTDVHRLRNELDPKISEMISNGVNLNDASSLQQIQPETATSSFQGQPVSQYTSSISGGTPVPGPPEWQTTFKNIAMSYDKNFGDITVNTSMSAVHVPLQVYPGMPEIMNGIAWSENLDFIFKKNFHTYMHVHHQYFGSHLGFLRTFPAHKWRIPRNEPDLFDTRSRPWYMLGASSPKNMVILVDASGSMTGLRREIAKGVVFELLDTLTANDYFSVMRFSDTVVPLGFPKCHHLKSPKIGSNIYEQCNNVKDLREKYECDILEQNWSERGQYLRDNPSLIQAKNASYMSDDAYKKSITNVTHEIENAFLLPASGRNVRFLKSNFTLPTGGIANFTNALMAAFELLNAYNRTKNLGSHCNQAIMLITDGAISSHSEVFNRFNYPNSPIRVFTYMIGREVGDIRHTKAMACNNRGYYTHVINLSEVKEQVHKYLPVLARPMVLARQHPVSWTSAYGDETYQVLTDSVLEAKRRERARALLNQERDRMSRYDLDTNYSNIEQTNITEYDEVVQADEELDDRMICEDPIDDLPGIKEIDPLGYNEPTCHWTSRRADLLISVVKPVFDNKNTTIVFTRNWSKNQWTEKETRAKNAQLLGIAAVDLRIAEIANLAPTHLLGPNGYAILIGNNGFAIHHPDLRALLEDPFDSQSKILKPYFGSMDLTHLEQVYHSSINASNNGGNGAGAGAGAGFSADMAKLIKLRELALRRESGSDSLYTKRVIDCQRRLQIKKQVFYYAPISDTPFSLILALPFTYGSHRLNAKTEMSSQTINFFTPSAYDLFTVHPDYKYCDSQISSLANLDSTSMILELIRNSNEYSSKIVYDDLTAVKLNKNRDSHRVFCDKELFPSLLFDAEATFESEDFVCPAFDSRFPDDCEQQTSQTATSSSSFSFYTSRKSQSEVCNSNSKGLNMR